MKMIQKLTSLAFIAASIFFFSCKKEAVLKSPAQQVTASTADGDIAALKSTDETVALTDAAGYSKLILRPGLLTGQDTWNNYLEGGDPLYLYGVSGLLGEIKVQAWTINGTPVYCRSLVRFDDLAKIPAGKTVTVAKLYLSGVRSSPVILPTGNSCYPGSPYGEGHNQFLIRRVTSSWFEDSVNWATQPTVTNENEVTTRASRKQWNDDLVIDVTTLVNDMVNKPAESYGFSFVLKNEYPYNSFGFYSSEAAAPRDRPTLYVKYK